jgi:type I restriction-modification system DNA methylase subunit
MTSAATVTAAEIARIAGVRPAAVSNWRRRYAEFPTPVGGTAASPQFSLAEVVDWLRENDRPVRLSPADEVWRAMEVLRDPARPAGILAAVGLHLLEGTPPASAGEDAGEPAGVPDDLVVRVGELGDRLGPAQAFEALLDRWVEAHSRQVEVTPAPVAALMTEFVRSRDRLPPGSVLDPACGTGSLLLRAAEEGTTVLLGQDVDPDLAEIASIRLRLHGHHDTSVLAGDSLLGDAHATARVQGVVCNPPFGQRNWGRARLGYDARWTYGLPPNAESELAWVQHALAHLDDGGRAALLMPAAAASRPSGRRIRAELVRRGTLRAVVALPSGSTSTHTLGTHLWLAEAPGRETASQHVLFTDAELLSAQAPDGRRTDTDWEAVGEAVVSAWQDFLAGESPDAALSRVVPIAELLADEVDVAPARHVRADPGPVLDPDELTRDRELWDRSLAALPDALPTVRQVVPPAEPRTLVSLDTLTRAGALRLWRGAARRDAGEDERAETPLLTLRDAQTGSRPSDRVHAPDVDRIAAGDVLVLAGSPEGARPALPAEYGAVAGYGVTVLRPDPRVLDAWFLAGALTAGPGANRPAGGSGTPTRPSRLDPARLFVPVRDLAEQGAIGRAFRDLARFNDALDRATELGRRTARRLADALGAGLVTPVDDQRD